MPVEVRVPQLGESIVEATVGKWLKKEGDSVAAGEAVVELETEKVSVEVAAEAAGKLGKIARAEGQNVRVGDVLATIETDGVATAAQSQAPVSTPSPEPAVAPPPASVEQAAEADQTPDGSRPSSPSARRVAEEHGVDLAQVEGSGPGGRVTREDVLAYLEDQRQRPAATAQVGSAPPTEPAPAPAAAPAAPPVPAQPAASALEERVRLSRRRLTIARRLVEAQQTAAMLTTFNEIDLTAVMELRRRRKESFQQRHGVGLGYMSFFTKASVGALKAFPRVNAELQGEELLLKYHYDIAIAIDTEGGLVVPVLRDADRKSFAEIEREIIDLATRARENKLGLADLQGGTFTITNGGIFGSLLSTPILNTPQVGILGMHRIEERPVALSGQVVIRPMMYVALSYDHRVIDGREAVQFLVRIKELLEDPETLLLEG
ncbi:MAG: 2-oxoglutarate dehydrogenase complex dihydrolipoyllysine-residue succinyltransferase [Chloroflexota bacterium]